MRDDLRAVSIAAATYCVTNTGIGGTTLTSLATVPRARVAPDGRFYGFSE